MRSAGVAVLSVMLPVLILLAAGSVLAGSAADDTSAVSDTTTAGEDSSSVLTEAAEQEKQKRLDELAEEILAKNPDMSEEHLEKAVSVAWQNEQAELSASRLQGWGLKPRISLHAKAPKVSWGGDVSGSLDLAGKSTATLASSITWDEYRKQDRTVERRSSLLNYLSGESLPVDFSTTMNWIWSDDQTLNSAGFLNQNRNEMKSLIAKASRKDVHTGLVRHNLLVDGSYKEQMGLVQSRRVDSNDGQVSGAVRSAVDATDGVVVTSSVYLAKSAGDKTLGRHKGDASAVRDSVGCGLFYDRGGWKGSIEVQLSNATKRYLDYNRNPSGVVDTTSVAEEDKIVNEHEKIDAITMSWDNAGSLGPLVMKTAVARSMDEQSFLISGVGLKEKLQDDFRASVSYRYAPRDSVTFEYRYLWKWDNQTYQSATEARGRQINKRREFNVQIDHLLVGSTRITLRNSASLAQDFAEDQFNDNDRDRFDTSGFIKLDSNLGAAKSYGRISYQHSEDISIRAMRSANNNAKDIYEIIAGYNWPITGRVTLKQDYRLSIQYTDYVFSYLSQVRREDDYNKRGMLVTKVSLKPSKRLRIGIAYDWNTKFNATRTNTTVTGDNQYRRDQDQHIGKVDVELSYDVYKWCTLEGATFRTRDVRDNLDGSDPTIRLSGELWVGMNVEKKWGGSASGNALIVSVRRYFAYGSTIQEYNAEYFDADVSFAWSF